jgi:hypothetical protein
MSTQIYMRDPTGQTIGIFENWSRLEYARGEGRVGYLYLDLDPNSVDTSIFRLDCRLEPWRQAVMGAQYLDGESPFFVRRWGYRTDAYGREVFSVKAMDANYIWAGANVAYDAKSAQAEQTDFADDMIKAIAAQNRGASATDTARSLAAYLTIQADVSAGPAITKAFSRRQVLSVMQDICAESGNAGTYLTFDTVWTSASMLELRTYTGQRGTNHGNTSGSRVVISREMRNLEEPETYETHEDEYTYVYAGGQGIEEQRVIETVSDTEAMGLSPFNRRELFEDARNTSTTAALQSEAKAALENNRARRVLMGKVVDTDSCVDGVHYRYGDLVYATYRGYGYDAHIDTLHVIHQGGRETRVNQIRAEVII